MNTVVAFDALRVSKVKKEISLSKDTDIFFSKKERRTAQTKAHPFEGLTARLAAKRAFFKVLNQMGYSFPGTMNRLEILNDPHGRPFFNFLDKKFRDFCRVNITEIFLSLTHTRQVGSALVAIDLKRISSQSHKR